MVDVEYYVRRYTRVRIIEGGHILDTMFRAVARNNAFNCRKALALHEAQTLCGAVSSAASPPAAR